MVDLSKLGQTYASTSFGLHTDFNYISIDELTDFCAVQMQACDTKIRTMTAGQQEIVQNGQQLADAQNALNDLGNAFGSKDKLDAGSSATDGDPNDSTTDAALYNQLVGTLSALETAAAGATEPAKGAIQKEINQLKSHLDLDKDGNPTQIKDKDDLLKQDVLDMSKDLQPTIDKNQTDQSMNMIKVQSAVGQREQMIQLVTGMIQKMNEMISSVVANIGK